LAIIFLDESGYTGHDLYSADQPVFVIATLNIPEDTCKALKTAYFHGVRAGELKHAALAKRPNQQDMVVSFLTELSQDKSLVKVSLAHKRFVLVSKMVDIIVEPALRMDGIDIYKNSMYLSLSNLLFFVLPALAGEAFFNDLLQRFQRMMRDLSPQAYRDFFDPLFRTHDSSQVDELLWFLRAGHTHLGPEFLDEIRRELGQLGLSQHSHGPLDIGFSDTVTLMALWRTEIAEGLELVHDESKRMASERHIWDALADKGAPAQAVKRGADIFTFPIAVEGTVFGSSRSWVGLQLADVVAGATAYYFSQVVKGIKQGDDYAAKLGPIVHGLLSTATWPSLDPIVGESEMTVEDIHATLRMFEDILEDHLDS
jgi:hypothetical protein